MDTEIEREDFDCPVLNDIAHIKRTYQIITSVGLRICAQFDCEECFKCGVAERDQQGNSSFNWAICPKAPR